MLNILATSWPRGLKTAQQKKMELTWLGRVTEKLRDRFQHALTVNSLRFVDNNEPLVLENDVVSREGKEAGFGGCRHGSRQLYMLWDGWQRRGEGHGVILGDLEGILGTGIYGVGLDWHGDWAAAEKNEGFGGEEESGGLEREERKREGHFCQQIVLVCINTTSFWHIMSSNQNLLKELQLNHPPEENLSLC